jgi:hypothetical protein
MNLFDFRIGLEFYTAEGKWRCTDVGTRVIAAIKLDAPDTSWYNGPPFAGEEIVFDEELLAAIETLKELRRRRASYRRPNRSDGNVRRQLSSSSHIQKKRFAIGRSFCSGSTAKHRT